MASEFGKRTEVVKTLVDERLFVDLNRLAIAEDRTFAEFIYLALREYAYGKSARGNARQEVPESDSSA